MSVTVFLVAVPVIALTLLVLNLWLLFRTPRRDRALGFEAIDMEIVEETNRVNASAQRLNGAMSRSWTGRL